MRALFFFCIVFAVQALCGSPSAKAEEVRIGVRVDTPPFASIDRDSGAYVGYFYKVCIEAVTRAGYQFVEKPINAENRMKFLNEGSGDIDLLCDPTTITLARMEKFAAQKVDQDKSDDAPDVTLKSGAPNLDYSQIVFVANGGYATATTAAEPAWQDGIEQAVQEYGTSTLNSCATYIDYADAYVVNERKAKESGDDSEVEEADANTAGDSVEPKKPLIIFRYRPPAIPPTAVQLLGYVVGSTIGEKVFDFRADYVQPVPCTLPSHDAAARAFCSGKLYRYYGDLDIVRASIANHNEHSESDCEPDYARAKDLTYEPYAFVVSARVPEFRERFACALYSMFEDDTMADLFDGPFKGEKSDLLSSLFAINSIPAGRRNVDPSSLDVFSSPYVCGVAR